MNILKNSVDNLIKLAFVRGRAYSNSQATNRGFDIKNMENDLKQAEKLVNDHSKRVSLITTIIGQATDCGIEYDKYPNIALCRMCNLSNYRADLLYGFNKHVTNFSDDDNDTRSFRECVSDLKELIQIIED